MRVLQLIESLEFGGAEKVMIDLANAMSARHEVTICCIKALGPLAQSIDPRIDVLCLRKKEGIHILLPFQIANILRNRQIEVLHAHNWGVFVDAGIGAAIANTGIRVHTIHGPYAQYGFGWIQRLKRNFRHLLERYLAHQFLRIVCVSDSIGQYVRDEIGIPASRLMTIHNGIAIGSKPPMRVGGSEVICVTVGRLAKIKNHELMIRAFKATNCSQARLWFVGDGPERDRLEVLVRELGIGDRVSFIGFRNDIAELLARGHIFVMSSDYEGISIAVLEAMRAGLPIIGTRVGGMSETVIDGHNGLLVDAQNVEAMAHAMRVLIESPGERERLGTAGRRLLETEFSIVTMVERYEHLYLGGPYES